jgi:hypothetical protein
LTSPGGASVRASRLVRIPALPADSKPLTRSGPESSAEWLAAEFNSNVSGSALDVACAVAIPLPFIPLPKPDSTFSFSEFN